MIHKAADKISAISPVLDVAAMVFAGVPFLGQGLLIVAVTADLISVADSGYNGVKEYKKNRGVDSNVVIDGIGVVTSLVGVGGLGAAKTIGVQGEGAAAAGVKAAKKYAAKMPRSFTRQNAVAAAQRALESAQSQTSKMLAVSATSGLTSDANTALCNLDLLIPGAT